MLELRAATRDLHHVVDHHPLLAPLVRPELSRQAYARALRAFLRLYVPLQPVLAVGIERAGGGFELADRVGWLRADLEFLGLAADLPREAWQPPLPADTAELVGMLYVVEGSTLGGQVIARRLEASLGVRAGAGATFFCGWGEQTPVRWEAFGRFAGRHALPGGRAAVAARGLFDAMLPVFDSALRWSEAACS